MSRMVPKRSYLVALTGLVLFTLFVYYKTLISEHAIKRYDTIRQILQFRHTADDVLPTMKYEPHYISPQKNYSGNLPEGYLDNKQLQPKGNNATCARFPGLYDIRFKNDHWQMQKTTNGTWHLFSAYLDLRNESVVRILATYDVWRTTEKFYCQFWYGKNNKFKIVESQLPFWMFELRWGADFGYFHHPYLVTCPVTMEGGSWPESVSLVDDPCQNANNNLKVRHKHFETKKNFFVCVKGLSFPYEDMSVRLIEWIELVNLLGAEKIHFYEFHVHQNIKRVLDYYTTKDLVEVTPIKLLDDFSNHPLLQKKYLSKKVVQRRLQEVIILNDCFYRHYEEFKYASLLDIDEVLVPMNGTWKELMDALQKTLPGGSFYLARNVYFLDNYMHQHDWFEGIPRYMHMLQHVYRTKNDTGRGSFVKGFLDAENVKAVHNHYPFDCVHNCADKHIDPKLAHLQHYRADCVKDVPYCEELKAKSVAEFRIWNYKDELIARVQRTMKELKFLYM